MSGGVFDPLVAIHQRLVREPDEGMGDALYPRGPAPTRWRPSFELRPYEAVDPESLKLGGKDSFHDLEPEELRAAILRVIDVEGPVHFDVLGDRLLTATDVSRMGARIRARIESEIAALETAGDLAQTPPFLGRREQFSRPPHRDWSSLPDKHRKLEHVADTELMLCLFHAVLEDEGIDEDEAMNRGIYRIGFIRLTQNARDRLQAPLEACWEQGVLRRASGGLYLGLEVFLRR